MKTESLQLMNSVPPPGQGSTMFDSLGRPITLDHVPASQLSPTGRTGLVEALDTDRSDPFTPGGAHVRYESVSGTWSSLRPPVMTESHSESDLRPVSGLKSRRHNSVDVPSRCAPVLLFQPEHRSGHPENYLFLSSKNIFSGSKYPKKTYIFLKQTHWCALLCTVPQLSSSQSG